MKLGVIGCGYWGPNLIRNFSENYHTDIKYVCDINENRLERIRLRYPHITATTNYKNILKDNDIQVVAIATPVHSHYNLAKDALEAGKHLLIEKPFTSKVKEAEELVELANKKNLMLFVDHTFIYTGAVKKIKEVISSGGVGDIYYFDSVRVNLGLFQSDINVIWDLAPHDVAIMDYLLTEKPKSVVATGASHTHSKIEDIAYVSINFKNNLIAHFHLNWMSPVKIRRIILGGNKKMIVFDDLDPADKVKIYDKGITLAKTNKKTVYQNRIQYRIGDMYAPNIDNTEALKIMVDHLADCLLNKKTPITDGESGLRVVRILEAAEKSMKKGGIKISL
ncbi:MAG: Gfo/Idh/MocA family oxidoreductase [Nitrospirae bacterium]|nr:Gfo/Idh/MocA family oxidoreductase [Nitrospirota bacterium]